MGQQPQVVIHINQGFFPVYIQVVSLYTMDEVIAAPTPEKSPSLQIYANV
jgi:hypothetical protein